jgi:hypothetical protein
MFQVTGVIQEAEHVVRHQRPSVGGLCRDCSKAATCTFPRDPSRPVWSCDEFEGSELSSTVSCRPIAAAPTIMVQREGAAGGVELKGLCRECTNRFTCCYPRPLGGVWHCDELA